MAPSFYLIVGIVLLCLNHPSTHSAATNKNMFKAGSKLNLVNIKSSVEVMADENNCSAVFVKDFGGRVLKDHHRGGHKIQTSATVKVEVNDTLLDTRCSFEYWHQYRLKEDAAPTRNPPQKRTLAEYDHNITLTSYYCDEIDGLYLTYP